jgi:hypothetical protein
LVDEHFVINPIYEGGRNKDWVDARHIPTLMTELGAYLKLSGSPWIFDKPKSGQGNAKMPTVNFSFTVSSDIPPEEIMARVNVDWNILRGTTLAVKNLGVFDTVTPMVIYFLWNDGHGPMILKELQQILSMVAPILLGGEQAELPPMALRKEVPQIPGQVTTDFQNLLFRAQMARRAWHMEVEKKHVETLIQLVWWPKLRSAWKRCGEDRRTYQRRRIMIRPPEKLINT